jgi:hypothetical protein
MTSSNNANSSNLTDVEKKKRNQKNYRRLKRKRDRNLHAVLENESGNTTNSAVSIEGLYL